MARRRHRHFGRRFPLHLAPREVEHPGLLVRQQNEALTIAGTGLELEILVIGELSHDLGQGVDPAAARVVDRRPVGLALNLELVAIGGLARAGDSGAEVEALGAVRYLDLPGLITRTRRDRPRIIPEPAIAMPDDEDEQRRQSTRNIDPAESFVQGVL